MALHLQTVTKLALWKWGHFEISTLKMLLASWNGAIFYELAVKDGGLKKSSTLAIRVEMTSFSYRAYLVTVCTRGATAVNAPNNFFVHVCSLVTTRIISLKFSPRASSRADKVLRTYDKVKMALFYGD